jgi:GT2 family glycosyltransferase
LTFTRQPPGEIEMDPGRIFVIILNWNGEAVLKPCLESLSRVSEPALEIIVVDNGSTDSSPETVRREFKGVELIENGRNLLFAAGNNVGIRAALERGAEFILLLNNDTEVDPRFVAEMLGAFDDPRTGIAGPKIFYYDDPERIWYGGGGFNWLTGVPFHRGLRRIEGSFEEKPGPTGWVTGCALMARREVFEQTGGLDPSYRIYCEDVDLCLRAAEAGWTLKYVPAAKVWHKVSSSSGGGMTPFKLENRIASTWKLLVRHRPLWWRVILLPVHAVGFLGLALGLLLTGRWRLLAAAMRGAARVLGVRKDERESGF